MVTQNFYSYMYIHKLLYTHIFWLCQLPGPRSNDTPVAMNKLRSWFLIPFTNKRSQSLVEKWLILGLEHAIYKVSCAFL